MARSPLLNMRLTESDKQRWSEAAEKQGMPLATWIRRCVEDTLIINPDGDSTVGTAQMAKMLLADEVVTGGRQTGKAKALAAAERIANAPCPRERFHRPGTFCKACGRSF